MNAAVCLEHNFYPVDLFHSLLFRICTLWVSRRCVFVTIFVAFAPIFAPSSFLCSMTVGLDLSLYVPEKSALKLPASHTGPGMQCKVYRRGPEGPTWMLASPAESIFTLLSHGRCRMPGLVRQKKAVIWCPEWYVVELTIGQ